MSALFKILTSALVTALLLVTGGCDNSPSEVEDYNPEPFLTAFLVNGEPVDEVWLERVAPLGEYYSPNNHGIRNAEIRIFEIGGADTTHFSEDASTPGGGHYLPDSDAPFVPRSLGHYRIEARTPQGEFLWAESYMPARLDTMAIFLVDENNNVQAVQEGDTLNRDMPNMYWDWGRVDSAGGYQGLITTLVRKDSLVGLNPDWKPEDMPEDTSDIERSGWTVFRWDQEHIILPWLYFSWVGPTRIELYAISGAYYDYLFSLYMQESGQVNHPQYNVHGGLGIFGLMSKRSMMIYMERVVYE